MIELQILFDLLDGAPIGFPQLHMLINANSGIV